MSTDNVMMVGFSYTNNDVILCHCRDIFGTFDCIWDLNAFDPINKDDKQR